jgi:hypothetical protein
MTPKTAALMNDVRSLIDDAPVATEAGALADGEMQQTRLIAHLVSVAVSEGLLQSEEGADGFIAQLKQLITKDKAALKMALGRATVSKARIGAKAMTVGIQRG